MLIFADGSSGERAGREHVSKPLFQAPGAQEPKLEPDSAASASAAEVDPAADADLVLWDAIGASLKARWRPEAVGSSMLRGLGLRSITAERQKEPDLRSLAQSKSPQAPQVQEGDTMGDSRITRGNAPAKAQVVQEGKAAAAGDTGTKEQECPLAPKFSEAVGKAEVGVAISGGAGSGDDGGGGGGGGGDESASRVSSERSARITKWRPAALTMGGKEGGGSSHRPGSLTRADDVTSVHSSASGTTAKTSASAALWRQKMGFGATTYGSDASDTMSKATVKTTDTTAKEWWSFFSKSPSQIAEGDGESTMSENASERDNRAFPGDDQDAAAPGGVSVKRDLA